jgi:SagB-type dehydrogenase family enzyme
VPPVSAVHRYHDGTKHHFHQFARSIGYLDWASQPHPFRRYAGAREFPLFPAPGAPGPAYRPQATPYDRLFDSPTARHAPLSAGAIGDLLRHSLGLSAWKQFRESRWSLRANPSSGNLHPTEAYIVGGPCDGLSGSPAVYHYAADRHALEQRSAFDRAIWTEACGSDDLLLLALTSIHWREAWKYGERAFRYCQHDLGHAVAAVSLAAAAIGWRTTLLPAWPQPAIAAITGLDRNEDFFEAEREEPGVLLAIGPAVVPEAISSANADLVAAIAAGRWTGRASRLSENHVQWTFIDEIARATEDPGSARGHASRGEAIHEDASASERAGGAAFAKATASLAVARGNSGERRRGAPAPLKKSWPAEATAAAAKSIKNGTSGKR